MAKLAVLSLFGQIVQPLEGEKTQNCNGSISYGILGYISRPLGKFKSCYFSLHPSRLYYLLMYIYVYICVYWTQSDQVRTLYCLVLELANAFSVFRFCCS